MLKDESEGSRLEISGIQTLTEAEEALAMLRSLGARDGDPLHCYLSGASFSFWVGRAEDEMLSRGDEFSDDEDEAVTSLKRLAGEGKGEDRS